jgi:argininosuccinate synthase
VVDLRQEFAEDFCLPALRANALYMERYPLVSALSRPVIAKHLVDAAHRYGADVVAHGCTGKGNDQVRFEVGIGALAPELAVLAPVRDSGMTRDKAIAFAEDKGPAHRPVQALAVLGGPEPVGPGRRNWLPRGPRGTRLSRTCTSYTQEPDLSAAPDDVVVSFTDGVPTAIDGRPVSVLDAILQLNQRAGAQGVGRLDMVEDRLVGIKSREVYEAPGAIALITAHRELEDLTVERDLRRYKFGVEQRWTELVYDGLWYSPLKRALDTFVDSSQQYVTGDVRLRLHGGAAVATGRRGAGSLYDYHLATYDTGDTFDQSLAKGFVQLWGLPSRMAARRDQRAGS